MKSFEIWMGLIARNLDTQLSSGNLRSSAVDITTAHGAHFSRPDATATPSISGLFACERTEDLCRTLPLYFSSEIFFYLPSVLKAFTYVLSCLHLPS